MACLQGWLARRSEDARAYARTNGYTKEGE